MIVAATEPKKLRDAATKVSNFPETFGADIAIRPHPNLGKGWLGIQRKEVDDLVSSIADGRLTQQVAQLEQCLMAFIVIEGKMAWTNEGELMSGWGATLNRDAMQSMMFSLMMRRIHVVHVDTLQATIDWCLKLETWASKPEHVSLKGRPGPDGGVWGQVGNREWSKHLLMGFPGIGDKTAGAIIDAFKGVPLAWTVEPEQLLAVPGLGKKRVDQLLRALQPKE